MSMCQKAVHRSGTFVVKIKHQNCLLQVNHMNVLCLKIIFSLTKNGLKSTPEEYNIKIVDPSDLVNRNTRYRVCNSSV